MTLTEIFIVASALSAAVSLVTSLIVCQAFRRQEARRAKIERALQRERKAAERARWLKPVPDAAGRA